MTSDKKLKKTFIFKIGPFKIEFFDLRTLTLEDHLQVLSVAINLLLICFGATVGPILMIFVLIYTRWWFLVPIYIAWIYYDRNTAFTGGRKCQWFRELGIFKYVRDYFPAQLIKTAELPPNTNYLMVMYPHGVLTAGVLPSFASAANKTETEVFPGLDIRCITLDINFYSPISREYFLCLGACGASESSITHLLKSEPSKAVVLVAGGASEAGLSQPGSTYYIVIKRRKGFVRIALKTGTPLVPLFSFGENNLYGQYKSEWLSTLQDYFCRFSGIRPVLPKGRGFLQNSFGLLPRSSSINTVVGKPIPVPKVEDPSKELIDEYHTKFVEALKSLFEEYKGKYDSAGNEAKLILI